ncbi:MAG TPA: NAD(P)H-hydrate dehydratase [Planctomycetaceae bacterium]|nr:NAD(P)H-hydrate dehydratase [Planctomycetaceae bacterium]
MKRVNEPPDLPERPQSSHKGTFGKCLIVAGSRGMSGAAVLAGLGALRAGAGLVFLAVPDKILDIVASVEPSYLTVPLPSDSQGRIDLEGDDALFEKASSMTAVAIGPGLGQSEDLHQLVARFYENLDRPLVVDADGLNNLAGSPLLQTRTTKPRILTPHPGEVSGLTGIPIPQIQNKREQVALEYARLTGAIVVLKGAGTIVTDGERLYVNDTGNSGMGTGGTGDVLTGILVSLLAQGMQPFDAASLAVYLHGLAGDLAAAELSQPGMIASDLPDYLAEVLQQLSETPADEE